MSQLVSPGFLFRWSIPVTEISTLPRKTGRLLDLPDANRLPSLSELDAKQDFADVRVAWNAAGLGISAQVSGRTRKVTCSAASIGVSDGLTVWIDTRNTQGVHRATRFCHQFCLLPSGGGRRNLDPVVAQIPLARAREEAAPTDLSSIQLQSEVSKDGYWLDAWFPAGVFVGFDPAASPLIGFHYLVRDTEFGDQTLSVGTEFPVASDPSLWQTLELVS